MKDGQLTVHSTKVPIESLQVDGPHIAAFRSVKELPLILIMETRSAVGSLYFLSVGSVLLVKARILHSLDTCDVALAPRAVKHVGDMLVFSLGEWKTNHEYRNRTPVRKTRLGRPPIGRGSP